MTRLAILAALALTACGAGGVGGALPCTLSLSYDPTTGAFEQSCRWAPPAPTVVEPTLPG